MFKLFQDKCGVDAELLRGVGGEFVAGDAAGDAADVGEQEVEGLDFGFGSPRREEMAGAVDQVVLMTPGSAEGGGVGVGAALANIAVGIEAAFEGEDVDLEALFGEKRDGFFGGVGAGGVGIEVDDDAGGVAAAAGATCASVKAVPLVAMTLVMPARKTEMQSIWPSTRTAPSSSRMGWRALSRLKRTWLLE